jgi:hypothetical protein
LETKTSSLWQKEQIELIKLISENVHQIKVGVDELLLAKRQSFWLSRSKTSGKTIATR